MRFVRGIAVFVGVALAALACGTDVTPAPAPVPGAPEPGGGGGGGGAVPPSDDPIPTDDVITDAFEVLDVDWASGKVAFRQTWHFQGEPGCADLPASVACGYAGMADHPESGVTLGVWNAKQDILEAHWDVYPTATSKAECASQAESEKRLAAAKAAFTAAGLDPDARPPSVTLASLGLTARYDSTSVEGTAATMLGKLVISKGTTVLDEREREFVGAMASRGTFEAPRAWTDGKRAIIQVDWTHQCGFECCGETTLHAFTPVLALDGSNEGATGKGKGKGKSKS